MQINDGTSFGLCHLDSSPLPKQTLCRQPTHSRRCQNCRVLISVIILVKFHTTRQRSALLTALVAFLRQMHRRCQNSAVLATLSPPCVFAFMSKAGLEIVIQDLINWRTFALGRHTYTQKGGDGGSNIDLTDDAVGIDAGFEALSCGYENW